MIQHPIIDPGVTTIIRRVVNGFELTSFLDIEEEGKAHYVPRTVVIEDTDEVDFTQCNENWGTVVRMLWALLEELELFTSKHDPKSIEIKVVDQSDGVGAYQQARSQDKIADQSD